MLLEAIEASALAEAVRRSAWAYPLLETVHIAGIAALLGSVLLLELRVFGLGREIGVVPLARLVLPTALAGFACAALSGSLLFASAATEFAANPVFLAKLALIPIAGLNALLFHARGGLRGRDAVARMQAAASLLLWLSVLAAGRLIAYV
ncbi:MAG: hypothetical protein MUF32_02610 [Burkholderiaceae bacterium]|jgi:hypothetical protein|nr:hypothetical protein [Burkholderiaceae bacterium]